MLKKIDVDDDADDDEVRTGVSQNCVTATVSTEDSEKSAGFPTLMLQIPLVSPHGSICIVH
jgi:hypothetical protein